MSKVLMPSTLSTSRCRKSGAGGMSNTLIPSAIAATSRRPLKQSYIDYHFVIIILW